MRTGASGGITHTLEGHILTVRVPMRFERIGGRKAIIAPEGVPEIAPSPAAPDAALLRALGRAYRWQRLLEKGTYGSAAELATAEKVNPSYLSRVLRLTVLAPDVVATILEGRQRPNLSLLKLLEGFPVEWSAQRAKPGLSAALAETS